MRSCIVLLDKTKEYNWAFKRMIDKSPCELMIDTLKKAEIDIVYVVYGQKLNIKGAKVVDDLGEAIKDINNIDVEILLLEDVYPDLRVNTVKALYDDKYKRIKGTRNIKLHIKDLANIAHIEFIDVRCDDKELFTVETKESFDEYKDNLRKSIIKKHVAAGVNIIDENNVYIGNSVKIGKGSTIEPNVCLFEDTTIGENTFISSGSCLINASIGNNTTVLSSRITDSSLGNKVTCGPNSHLRMHSEVADEVRIGNFVEFKNTKFGYKSRCAHLTYLGDTEVGEDVNIGCGVVTVNYDGAHKFKTKIGDHAFIGSNANLIAPIKIGNYALVAAGSTVNGDVADGDMAIARSRQSNKEGYGYSYINKEKDA